MSIQKRTSRFEKLFEMAASLPPEEQTAFLAQAGLEEAAVRELASLLQAEAAAGDFLKNSANGEEPITIGRRLGAYLIQSRIGEGGMSQVFRAERADDQFRKRVAVKIMPPAMAGREYRRRFQTERHILACLEHPNIARLYDAGATPEGLPYFVMEYVEGEPIDDYCDRHRLTIPERLVLFGHVCRTVHYAHRNLVVHRDLKPGNILVTENGVPKLLDFGIAKLLNPELCAPSLQPTTTLHRVLTPNFASPEQVQGKAITTASDVYSLGVLLYTLLCGRLPHQLADKSPGEIERILETEEPVRPSKALLVTNSDEKNNLATICRSRQVSATQLERQLRGDLDNIVSMAMRKEPQRRYRSAAQLGEDIEHHLKGHPVMARPKSLTYRFGKYIQRNRMALAMTGLIFLLVTGFASTLAVQASRLAVERDRAQRERDKNKQVLSYFVDVFKMVDPAEGVRQNITAHEALDPDLESLEEMKSQPEFQTLLWTAFGCE